MIIDGLEIPKYRVDSISASCSYTVYFGDDIDEAIKARDKQFKHLNEIKCTVPVKIIIFDNEKDKEHSTLNYPEDAV